MACPLPFWGPTTGPIRLETTEQVALAAALVGASIAKLVALTVSHGILRPFLEARGVTPWTVRDSLFATPLIATGAACIGGAGSYLAIATVMPCPAGSTAVVATRVLCLGLLATGALVLRLGVLALRKLT